MKTETTQFVQKVNKRAATRFYKPMPDQLPFNSLPDDNASHLTMEWVRRNAHFEGLATQFVTLFEENSKNTQKYKAGVGPSDRIQFFTNGDVPHSPLTTVNIPKEVFTDLDDNPQNAKKQADVLKFSVRNSFAKQVMDVVSMYCADLSSLGEGGFDGFTSDEARRTFFNMREIAPQLTKALIDRGNYVTLVQEGHAINAIAAALHMARYPESQLTLRVGIGGSDDPFTTARFPAYGLPALKIAEQVTDVYKNREAQRIKDAAIKKVIQGEEDRRGITLDKAEKRELLKDWQDDPDNRYADILTDEEYNTAFKTYGIAKNPVKIQFVFAHEAAVAVNETKDPDRIRQRTRENIAAMDGFIGEYFPNIRGNIEYLVDKPWSSHTSNTKHQLEYFAHLLRARRAEDPTIDQTLKTLEKMGVNHGGEKGKEEAALYAGAHPPIFGDRMNMPFVGYFEAKDALVEKRVDQHPSLLITIGGEPERHFSAMREYLAEAASPEGFLKYLREREAATENPTKKGEYQRTQVLVRNWQRMTQRRKPYVFVNGAPDPAKRMDHVLHNVPLITPVGQKPAYFATHVDRPYGINVDEHKDELERKAADLRTQREALSKDPSRNPQAEKKLHDEVVLVEAVAFDITALHKEINKKVRVPVAA